MRRRAFTRVLAAGAVVSALAPAAALAASGAGGTQYGSSGSSTPGGSEFGAPLGKPTWPQPVATVFRVSPSVVRAGSLPTVVVRIDQPGALHVRARLVFLPEGTGSLLRVDLGKVLAGQAVTVRFPRGTKLAPGSYAVQLHARGRGGLTLLRQAHTSGRAALTVRAPRVTPPPVAPVVPPPVAAGLGVFPVQGPHTYGDPFGAPRKGYTHQGQDVLAAQATPVVAPEAGTVTFTGDQPSAAGFYVVMHAEDGRDFFFAHCEGGSIAVTPNEIVIAGQQLCKVGRTGDASGPHLHFEIWVNGWRSSKDSHPIDPLPDLRAWDHA
jgi:murein DD-endopeptidase MepM/ murein hydrolase activator NlpD